MANEKINEDLTNSLLAIKGDRESFYKELLDILAAVNVQIGKQINS